MDEISFITNHGLILAAIARSPHSTARELGGTVGITERATRKIIADLDEDGYIDKTKEGRRVRYGINAGLSLRADTHQDIAIGDFLQSLGWNKRKKRNTKK